MSSSPPGVRHRDCGGRRPDRALLPRLPQLPRPLPGLRLPPPGADRGGGGGAGGGRGGLLWGCHFQ